MKSNQGIVVNIGDKLSIKNDNQIGAFDNDNNLIPVEKISNSYQDENTVFIQHLMRKSSRIQLYKNNYHINGENRCIHFYLLAKDRIYLPLMLLPSIEHQISHMVEMYNCNKERLLLPDWGLVSFIKKKPSPKGLLASMVRETRVRAIQSYINKNYHPVNKNSAFDDWISEYLPLGRFHDKKSIDEWIEKIRQTTFSRWSLDRIETDWNSSIEYIENNWNKLK